MKLTVEEVLDRVNQTEDELRAHREMTKTWERMWQLDAGFTKPWKQSVEQDGREQVTLPDPYNIVNLAMRLISTQPRVMAPPKSEANEDRIAAEKIERWLQGMWQRASWQQNRNLIQDATWQALVLGSCIFEVKWIKEVLPKKLQKERFPILIRTLDPREVGIKRGALYVEWAYHRYKTDITTAKQRYPKLKKWREKLDQKLRGMHRRAAEEEICIIDYWWTDEGGDVWNSIVVDEEFHKKPTKMDDYPYIPFVEGYGDSAPTLDEAFRRLSILYPIDGLWQYQCRLASNLGTAALWGTWPFYLVTNEQGQMVDDIEVRPGATQAAPLGTRIEPIMPQADIGKIQAMLQQVQTSIQQASFPGVMYGESGNMQAGYGVNLLSAAASGRVKQIMESLEMTVQAVNELALAMVDIAGGSKGVELYAFDKANNRAYVECLYPKELKGYYRNIVTLKPNVPQDDMAKQTLGVRLADGKYISAQTLRDFYLSDDIPPDEESRVWTEIAHQSEELQPRLQVIHLISRYPEEVEGPNGEKEFMWMQLIRGTQLEGVAKAMNLWPEPPPPPEPPPGMMPPGMEGMPPMPPGMEGMMPPEMMGGPPPGMMPPGMEGMPVQPPAELVGPMGGGIPPVMQGQMEPEMLGLPPGADPLLVQQLMGNPISPQDELNMLAGGPPMPPGA